MSVESDPQKRFLRDRLQARCLERATKARERAVRKKRQDMFGEPSSDDFQMEDDSEEDDETIMQDEVRGMDLFHHLRRGILMMVVFFFVFF